MQDKTDTKKNFFLVKNQTKVLIDITVLWQWNREDGDGEDNESDPEDWTEDLWD